MHQLSYKSLFIIILFLLIPIVFLLKTQKVSNISAAWFDDAWTYRQAINISSHTAAETNVYIVASVNIGTTTKSQTDNGDFRFTTQSGQLLDYFISAGVGTTNITFHINIDSFPAGSQTIYAYYGNPIASNGYASADFLTQAANYVVGSPAVEEIGGGPIAWWKFDEGVGTSASDSTSSRNDGLIFNAIWQTDEQCISEKCLNFNASNNYIKVANNNSLKTPYITFSTWVKLIGAGSGNFNGIVERLGGTNSSNKNRILVQLDRKILMQFSGLTQFNSNASLSYGSWYNIAYTYQKVYINGQLDSAQLDVGNTINTGSSPIYLGIGSTTSNTYFLNGNLDNIKIYPYARSATQIKQDYTAGLSGQSSSQNSNTNIGSNSQKSLSDGLVGYWKFDEGTGTTSADSSGNSNLAIFAAGSSAPSWSTGKYGVGVTFDGIGSYISTAGSNITTTGNSTISLWTKMSVTNDTKYLFSGIGSCYQRPAVFDSSGHLGFYNGTSYVYGSKILSDNIYHHIVVVDRSSPTRSRATYIDGVQDISWNDLTGGTYGANNCYINMIGGYGGSSAFFNGVIDEVKFYNRALNPTEIKALYSFSPGPVGYWKFDEGTGTITNDSSGNNNAAVFATGSSAPTWVLGKIGKGLSFDGSYDYLSSTSSLFNLAGNSDFTVCHWLKATISDGTIRRIISQAQDANNGWQVNTANNNYYFAVNKAGTKYSANLPTVTNTWQHICGSFNNTTNQINIYSNGIGATGILDSQFGFAANFGTVYLGNIDTTSARFFTGLVDDVKIYNYARTPEQIIQDMGGSSKLAGPIAWYKFDEGQGLTTNNSGIGGTLNISLNIGDSAPTWSTNGKVNKALIFDGINDALSFPLNIVNFSQITYSAWVKINGNPPTTQYSVVTGNFGRSGLFINTNGHVRARAFDTTDHFVDSVSTVTNNQWHHIAATYDQTTTTTKIYVDGKFENQMSYFPTILSNPYSYIGENPKTGVDTFFNGQIDEVKVYNYALSSDEVKQDYNALAALVVGTNNQTIGATTTSLEYCLPGDTSPCSPPVAEWKFDEGLGTTVYDIGTGIKPLPLLTGTFSPQWQIGKFGKGLYFDGNDGVGYNDGGTVAAITGPVTVNAWVKTNASTSGGIVCRYGNSGTWTYCIYMSANGKANFIRSSNTGPWSTNVVSNTSINNNNWNLITAKYDGSSMQLFINGIADNTLPETRNSENSLWSFCIGNQHYLCDNTGYNGHFTGLIDQVRIYNYARTPAQIAYDYNKGSPIGWWKFDECQGNTSNDSSDSNMNGSISIGPSGTQTSAGTCATSGAWFNGVTGKFNSSLNFDGTDDYADLSSGISTYKTLTQGTISAWFKTSTDGYITSISKSTGNGFVYLYVGNSTGTYADESLAFAFRDSGSVNRLIAYYRNGTSLLKDNQWHQAIFAVSDVGSKMYVDSKEVPLTYTVGSSSTTGYFMNDANFDFFSIFTAKNNNSFASYHSGQIDDVRIYNYALTNTQIKALYSSGAVNFN